MTNVLDNRRSTVVTTDQFQRVYVGAQAWEQSYVYF